MVEFKESPENEQPIFSGLLEVVREMADLYKTSVRDLIRALLYPELALWATNFARELDLQLDSLHRKVNLKRGRKRARPINPQLLRSELDRMYLFLKSLQQSVLVLQTRLSSVPPDLVQSRLLPILQTRSDRLVFGLTPAERGKETKTQIDFLALLKRLGDGDNGIVFVLSQLNLAIQMLDDIRVSSPYPGIRKKHWALEEFQPEGLGNIITGNLVHRP